MSEPSFSVFWSDAFQRLAGGLIEQFFASGLGGSQNLLELRPSFFDWVEIGRIGRKIEELRACCLDLLLDAWHLVRTQVVHHHHVTRSQRRNQKMLDIGAKDLAVGGGGNGHGSHHAGQPQSGNQGDHAPMRFRRGFYNAHARRSTTVEARHGSRQASLIEKDKMFRLDFRDGRQKLPAAN